MRPTFIHCGSLWYLTLEVRARAVAAGGEIPPTWPAHSLVAVVLATTTAEAFINELSWALDDLRVAPTVPAGAAPLRACAAVIRTIEEEHGSLLLKCLAASQALSGCMFDRGAQPFQDFTMLVRLRNDIVHLRPRDTFRNTRSAAGMDVSPYIIALQRRGIAREVQGADPMVSWLNRLQTASLAEWACDAALGVIDGILGMAPPPSAEGDDPVGLFRDLFGKK